ncbi:radical SAM protein [Streptomyces sp. NPDC005500]|uniref:radical SAM protein n=1 Tax=Streptomyces sp. NPDC005500 TaxID=3155007 RepID=UPI0033A1FC0C
MDTALRPSVVIWDITYACPLRCIHCYSESGRRPTRQLAADDLLRVAGALISLRPAEVALAGGEPLLVPGMMAAAERISAAGIQVSVYTSGWTLRPEQVEELAGVFTRIHVSVDGATAPVHDGIRGRTGSFERAMNALDFLDDAAELRRAEKGSPIAFGVDWVAVRSNFHEIERFCTDIAPRFRNLAFAGFGAAVPSGLASRQSFADRELLSDAQASLLKHVDFTAHLRSLLPDSVRMTTTDNRMLQMRPDQVERGEVMPGLQVEPDGEVRAMPIYEGTVGNILTENPYDLWARSVARWSHPVVTEALSGAYSMQEWAQAARRIDYHFGSAAVRARIDARPDLQEGPTVGRLG